MSEESACQKSASVLCPEFSDQRHVLNISFTFLKSCFSYTFCVFSGKAVPLQAWTGPEVSRKLKFPDYVTTAQDGGKVVSLTHLPPLPPGNTPGTHLC